MSSEHFEQWGSDRVAAVLAHAPDVVAVVDDADVVRYVSRAVEGLTGRAPAAVTGSALIDLVHPDDRGVVVAALAGWRERPIPSRATAFRITGLHGWRTVEAFGTDCRHIAGIAGIVLALRDVSDRDGRDGASEPGPSYRDLVASLDEGVMMYSPAGEVLAANPAAIRMLGRAREDIEGSNVAQAEVAVLAEDGTALTAEEFPTREVFRTGQPQSRVIGMRSADGEVQWLSVNCRTVASPDAAGPEAVVASFTDITALKRAHDELRSSERRFRSLVHHASDAFIVCEVEGTIGYASQSSRRLLGVPPEELRGQPIFGLVHEGDRARVRTAFNLSLSAERPATAAPVRVGFRCRQPNGQFRHLEATFTNMVGDPSVGGVVINARDVTERRLIEADLTYQALHDSLTGLPNRALLLDRLTQALGSLPRQPGGVALLFCDVDHFKVINDTLGHEVGDQVLVHLARQLRAAMRPGDTVARFGGDEFVVLCRDIDPREATAVAERLAAAAGEPFRVGGRELQMTFSTGIALAGPEPAAAEAVIRAADTAMYRAKEQGRGRAVVFDEQMRTLVVSRLAAEQSLRAAIDAGELVIHYQPVVELSAGAVVGAEALVRWLHPDRGLVLPDEFLPVGEESGLVGAIGEWTLLEACRQSRQWELEGVDDASANVAVNVSMRELQEPDLVTRVAAALTETGIPPRRLIIEIPERVLMEHADITVEIVSRVKELGVGIAVDDFGTGYSSLTYLKRFSVDAVKVDRTLIGGIGRSREDTAIVAAVLNMAEALGLRTIAKGVETVEQMGELIGLGCQYAQGFYFGRPTAPNRLQWLPG
ncbi:MAG: hypothetical protein QOG64_2314 [Acidimicrobiaceae bacterium]|nr:hypothetical protein [Acidimicrobiaceae bacterium]